MANVIFHFYGKNYDMWKIKMMTLFKSQKLWDIVIERLNISKNISTLKEAQQKELNVKEQKDTNAFYLIQQSLANTIFPRITGASTRKQACDMLWEEFLGDSKVHTIKI
jgi:hypothetical protein